MAELPENSVDTIITDPPYGLEFMGKDWDKGVPGVAFWEQALRVAKPGAMLLAMGGTRTFHRLVCAIEDAGWEVRDSMAWLYGSGFPKSYNIGKAIESTEVTGSANKTSFKQLDGEKSSVALGYNKNNCDGEFRPNDYNGRETTINHVLHTENGKLWDGWGTALKPAMELICVAMKPIDGTYVNNALAWGVAGLWIDGGRVGYAEQESDNRIGTDFVSNGGDASNNANDNQVPNKHYVQMYKSAGRFPANVIHDGSDEVTGLFPQGGNNKGYTPANTEKSNADARVYGFATYPDMHRSGAHFGDSGSAARFFYCAKASRSERNAGLEGMEERWIDDSRKEGAVGGNNPRNRGARSATNHHPTVKPLALMRYLARLTKTPTGGVVLDPFMGSGTTGCACALEGRDFIGIELNEEYMEIAKRRIADAQMQPRLEVEE